MKSLLIRFALILVDRVISIDNARIAEAQARIQSNKEFKTKVTNFASK